MDRVILAGSPEMAAALSNFVPATKLKGMEDFLVEEDQLKYYEESAEFQVVQEEDDVICFPTLLRAFMFPRGDVSRFPPPKRSSYGTSSNAVDMPTTHWLIKNCTGIVFSFHLKTDSVTLSLVTGRKTTYEGSVNMFQDQTIETLSHFFYWDHLVKFTLLIVIEPQHFLICPIPS